MSALALLAGPNLRALAKGVGSARIPRGAGGGRDPTVLELCDRPFGDAADAHDRLDALADHFRERGDRRAVFLSMYVQVTEGVRESVDAGEFAEPEWALDYLTAFADLYRRALFDYERGELGRVPDAWTLAFAHAEADDRLVTQHALLGVNAHILHDLALALDEVGIGAGATRARRYGDHVAVNRVLESLVEDLQTTLAADAPGFAAADVSLGRVDELLAAFSVAEAREHAWRVAVALADALAPARPVLRWYLDAVARGAAQVVLAPSPDVVARLRAAESGAETGS